MNSASAPITYSSGPPKPKSDLGKASANLTVLQTGFCIFLLYTFYELPMYFGCIAAKREGNMQGKKGEEEGNASLISADCLQSQPS